MSGDGSPVPDQDGDWLAGCRGFEVDSPRGRVGVLDDIRRDATSGRPEALIVRAGTLFHHRLVIPVEEVAGVMTSKRVIVLQSEETERPSLPAPEQVLPRRFEQQTA